MTERRSAAGWGSRTSGPRGAGIAVGDCRCSPTSFAHGRAGPADEGGVQAFPHFLLLLIKQLLRHFLPGEAEIAASSGNERAGRSRATVATRWSGPV